MPNYTNISKITLHNGIKDNEIQIKELVHRIRTLEHQIRFLTRPKEHKGMVKIESI